MVEKNVQVNLRKKEITFYVTENTHHIYNQMSNLEKSSDRKKKMWQMLLDSQSTCDVIINRSILKNVRVGGWNLKLQT